MKSVPVLLKRHFLMRYVSEKILDEDISLSKAD